MKTISRIIALPLAALAFAAPAHKAQAASDGLDMLAFSLGYYDIINEDYAAADFRAEYRFGTPLVWHVKPWVGVEVTSDASVYGVAGFYGDIDLTDRVYVTPSIGVGLYSDGDGKDLGHAVEFRSQLELGYRFDNDSSVSVGFSHTSNADLGDSNPGTEVLSLYYKIPINFSF